MAYCVQTARKYTDATLRPSRTLRFGMCSANVPTSNLSTKSWVRSLRNMAPTAASVIPMGKDSMKKPKNGLFLGCHYPYDPINSAVRATAHCTCVFPVSIPIVLSFFKTLTP